MFRLNITLEEVERKHHVQRWTPLDEEYECVKQLFTFERQNHVGQGLWTSAVQRQFLLKLKSKYAGV